jgi:phosphoribosylformylglycinamidine synthase
MLSFLSLISLVNYAKRALFSVASSVVFSLRLSRGEGVPLPVKRAHNLMGQFMIVSRALQLSDVKGSIRAIPKTRGRLPVPYEVIVELKPEVLDAEGRAIAESLQRLGHKNLCTVKVSKRFVIEMADSADPKAAEEIARQYLANPVSETFVVRKM